jgi:transposase
MAIDTVVQRAAGLDIAKASLVVCFRTPDAEGGWQITKRKFTTITADLLVLADWLGEHGITRVGMESTADNWRPVFYLLEHRFDCWLFSARHMRAVPGRKTDAEWICDWTEVVEPIARQIVTDDQHSRCHICGTIGGR